MKILNKTLDVLEFVINYDGVPVTPGVIADKLGISAVSCVRVLTDLTARGYLERVSRNTGYVPGPAVFTFKDRLQWGYARLVEAAREPIDKLASELHTIANISVMNRKDKYILYHASHDGLRTLVLQTRYSTEHCCTATGRLLMACCCTPEEQAEIFASESELICREWAGVSDMTTFSAMLRRTAREGTVSYVDSGGTAVIGRLVRLPKLTAAIGFGCHEDQIEQANKYAELAARQITINFTPKPQVF